MTLRTRTPEVWLSILVDCGVAPAVAAKHAPAFAEVLVGDALSAGEDELDDFLGQVLHESGMLTAMRENMGYSAKRIRELGERFGPGSRWHAAATIADQLEFNPKKLANFLYHGRFGNGDDNTNDGWRYRGGGDIMMTFKNAYVEATRMTGIDLVNNPEQIEDPLVALKVAVAWWERNVPDDCMDDLVRVTKRVQGGNVGIQHRGEVTAAAREALATWA